MKCEDMREQIMTGLLDHELTAGKKAEVEQHLAVCSVCRDLFAVMRKLNDEVGAAPLPEAPPERVWSMIRSRIEERPVSIKEKITGWLEGFLWDFRPTFAYGSMVAGLLVICVVAFPLIAQREQRIAQADQEELVQLVYADDEASSIEDIGSGTFVEYLL